MSGAPGSSSECPLCDKPVMGRSALLGHLEFGHDITDPEAYLAELERPAEGRRRALGPGAARIARLAGVVAVLVAVVVGGFAAYQALAGDDPSADDEPVASGAPSVGESTTSTPPTTSEPVVTTATAAPTTTSAPTTSAAATEDLPFRVPFLLDAEIVGCTRRGDVDVHEFRFEFSGARNITFDGVFYPDDTGDGPHTTTRELPAGTDAYVDEVIVEDPSGDAHRVEIDPPLYLGNC